MPQQGFVFVLLASVACAQWTPAPPRLGYFVDRQAGLRALYGVAGNFVAGELRLEGVIGSASSSAWTVAKLERAVVLLDAEGAEKARLEAPPGPALFAFDEAGRPALSYFPAKRLVCRILGETLVPLRSLEQDVAAIAWLDDQRFLALVRRNDRLELVEFTPAQGDSGRLLEKLPAGGPVLMLGRGTMLSAEGALLHLHRMGGLSETFAMPAAIVALNAISDEWAEIITADAARFGLRLREGQAAVYALPEDAP